MTASYNPYLSDNVSLVRFHIGDTNTDGAFLQDETIQYWLTNTASTGEAVIACIKYIITQLSQPGFKLDWLTVDNVSARTAFMDLLKQKAQEFNVSLSSASFGTSVSTRWRADSNMTVDDSWQEDADTDWTEVL